MATIAHPARVDKASAAPRLGSFTPAPDAHPRPCPAPEPDRRAMVQFLREVLRGEHIHLVSIPPDGGAISGREFGGNIESAADWAEAHNSDGRGVYFSANIVRAGVNKKPTRTEILEARFAHVDIDPPLGGQLDKAAVQADLVLDGLATAVIDSGNGVQALWRLKAPCAGHDPIEAVNKALVARFGGDTGTWNADRVLRLPGTVNWPSAKKRAEGRVPVLARPLFAGECVHSVAALAAAFPQPQRDERDAGAVASGPELASDDDVLALLRRQDGRRLREGKLTYSALLDDAATGDEGHGGDASGADAALASALMWATGNHLEQAERLFLQSDRGVRDKVQDRPAYVLDTIQKMRSAEPYDWLGADPHEFFAPIGGAAVGAPEGIDSTPLFRPAAAWDGKPLPPREWLVDGLIPMGTVTLLYGDGGNGKSLLAQQLAAAVAEGGEWVGHKVRRGKALFLSAEDPDEELHRRMVDIASADGRSLATYGDLLIRSMVDANPLLAQLDPRQSLVPSPLYRRLRETVLAERPTLLVLDTLANLFPGNENDRAQVQLFVNLLKDLAASSGCAVVLLAHPSRAGMATGTGDSGSTAWSNAVRSRLYLDKIMVDGVELNPNRKRLSLKKSNYGARGGDMTMEWGAGVFRPLPGGDDACAEEAAAQVVFMSLLDRHTAQGRHVSANGGATFAPAVFARHRDSGLHGKLALRQAMEDLLSAGVIAQISVRDKATRKTRWALVRAADAGGDGADAAAPRPGAEA